MHDDVDFTNLMEKWKDRPPRDDGEGGLLSMARAPTSVSKGTQIIEVTVPGVNEVLSKALEEAQEGYKATVREAQAVMKDAKDDHKAAVRATCIHNHIQSSQREKLLHHKIFHYQEGVQVHLPILAEAACLWRASSTALVLCRRISMTAFI